MQWSSRPFVQSRSCDQVAVPMCHSSRKRFNLLMRPGAHYPKRQKSYRRTQPALDTPGSVGWRSRDPPVSHYRAWKDPRSVSFEDDVQPFERGGIR
jgi:hypothetical protein